MRYRFVVLGLWLALLASGCVSSSNLESYRPKNQDEAFIVSMLTRIPDGIKARSVDVIMQPYADDVYIGNFQKYIGVAGPTAPLSISKRDLRQAYTELLKASKDITMTVKDFRLVSVSGDLAVAEARTELFMHLEATRYEQREQTYLNDVTWRMRRSPAGWKIVEEIWQ
jgi:ketosteroid isomerase-like protein